MDAWFDPMYVEPDVELPPEDFRRSERRMTGSSRQKVRPIPVTRVPPNVRTPLEYSLVTSVPPAFKTRPVHIFCLLPLYDASFSACWDFQPVCCADHGGCASAGERAARPAAAGLRALGTHSCHAGGQGLGCAACLQACAANRRGCCDDIALRGFCARHITTSLARGRVSFFWSRVLTVGECCAGVRTREPPLPCIGRRQHHCCKGHPAPHAFHQAEKSCLAGHRAAPG